MEMPNSNPASTTKEHFLLKKELAQNSSIIDYALWAGATADNFNHLDELKAEGCIAFKAFTLDAGPTFPWLNLQLQMEAMKKTKKLHRILGFHAEDPVIVTELTKYYRQYPWSIELQDKARPYYAELAAINQIILFSKETGCPVHICHLSIPEGAELIKKARKEGVDITVESCSHYFLLNLENAASFDTYALIQPPLRDKKRMEKCGIILWMVRLITLLQIMPPIHLLIKNRKPETNGMSLAVLLLSIQLFLLCLMRQY